jgi:F-box domain
MQSLGDLPPELLEIILQKCDRASLAILCRVSRWLREPATPFLFSELILGYNANSVVQKLSAAIENNPLIQSYVFKLSLNFVYPEIYTPPYGPIQLPKYRRSKLDQFLTRLPDFTNLKSIHITKIPMGDPEDWCIPFPKSFQSSQCSNAVRISILSMSPELIESSPDYTPP